jgi:hypothetical protein
MARTSFPSQSVVADDMDRNRKKKEPPPTPRGTPPPGSLGAEYIDPFFRKVYDVGSTLATGDTDPRFAAAKVGPMPPPIGAAPPVAPAARPAPPITADPQAARKAQDAELVRTTADAAAAANRAGAPPGGQGPGQDDAQGTGTNRQSDLEKKTYQAPKAVMHDGKITLTNVAPTLASGTPVSGRPAGFNTGVIGEALRSGRRSSSVGTYESEWAAQKERDAAAREKFGGGITPYDERRAFVEWSQFKTAADAQRRGEEAVVSELDKRTAEALQAKTRAQALTEDPFAPEKASVAAGAAGEIAKQTGRQREEATRAAGWEQYMRSVAEIDKNEEAQIRAAANDQERVAEIRRQAQAAREEARQQYLMFQSGVLGQRGVLPREEGLFGAIPARPLGSEPTS